MKITKQTTIKEFMDYAKNFICDEAKVWLRKLGTNKPLEYAWKRCARPHWLEFGVYIAKADRKKNSIDYFRNINKATAPIRKIKREHGMMWHGDMFDAFINKKQADIIRANFNPFKED